MCIFMSRSQSGLQNTMDKTKLFYDGLGLEINKRKTKVMVFNKRGIKLSNYYFYIDISELFDKAWFAISNNLYKYKRLPVSRAFKLFDSLIKPILPYFDCQQVYQRNV